MKWSGESDVSSGKTHKDDGSAFVTWDVNEAYKLARRVSVSSGVGFCRIDIVKDEEGKYRVLEFTPYPGINSVVPYHHEYHESFQPAINYMRGQRTNHTCRAHETA